MTKVQKLTIEEQNQIRDQLYSSFKASGGVILKDPHDTVCLLSELYDLGEKEQDGIAQAEAIAFLFDNLFESPGAMLSNNFNGMVIGEIMNVIYDDPSKTDANILNLENIEFAEDSDGTVLSSGKIQNIRVFGYFLEKYPAHKQPLNTPEEYEYSIKAFLEAIDKTSFKNHGLVNEGLKTSGELLNDGSNFVLKSVCFGSLVSHLPTIINEIAAGYQEIALFDITSMVQTPTDDSEAFVFPYVYLWNPK